MPILSSGLPLVSPPNARSTMKAVTLSFLSPVTGSTTIVRANTVNISAMPPLLIQILLPLRRKCLPSADRVARVRMDPASDPLDGSVSAKAATCSPDASLGRYFCFCASLPNIRIPLRPILWCAIRVTARLPSCEMTSTTRAYAVFDRPRPPYSWGIWRPKSPSSLSPSIVSFGICASLSIRLESTRSAKNFSTGSTSIFRVSCCSASSAFGNGNNFSVCTSPANSRLLNDNGADAACVLRAPSASTRAVVDRVRCAYTARAQPHRISRPPQHVAAAENMFLVLAGGRCCVREVTIPCTLR
eukprot:Opistho-2@17497